MMKYNKFWFNKQFKDGKGNSLDFPDFNKFWFWFCHEWNYRTKKNPERRERTMNKEESRETDKVRRGTESRDWFRLVLVL